MSDRDTMQNEAMHARRQFERELKAQDKRRTEKTVQVPISVIEVIRKESHPYTCDSHNMYGIPAHWGECDCWHADLAAIIDPPTIVTGMRVAYLMGGAERIVGEFHDGAWDLIIPGTEKSRMSVEPEVFWETVRLVTGPSVEDMAPGTTFTARVRLSGAVDDHFTVMSGPVNIWLRGEQYEVTMPDRIDPSTIRNITPPEETS